MYRSARTPPRESRDQKKSISGVENPIFFSFSSWLWYQLSRLMDALTGVWPVLLVDSVLVLDRYRILYLSPKGSSVSTVHHYILYSTLRLTEEAQYMAYGEEKEHCFFCCPVPIETSTGKDKSIRSTISDLAYTRLLKKKSIEIKYDKINKIEGTKCICQITKYIPQMWMSISRNELPLSDGLCKNIK